MITQHTVLSAHQTVIDECSHCLNLCIAAPSCHRCSARRILLPPWGRQDGESEGGREKNNSGKRGFSTSSLTKSHHFRRLTSVCDKCSTSSSLPISLELETPEASAACKIKNDHLIHSSTKYISGERRKKQAEESEEERECVASALPLSAVQNPPQLLLLNEVLIQTDLCIANRSWHCDCLSKFLFFSYPVGLIALFSFLRRP